MRGGQVPSDLLPRGRDAMARIKIKDLPKDAKVTEEEMAQIRGGVAAVCLYNNCAMPPRPPRLPSGRDVCIPCQR